MTLPMIASAYEPEDLSRDGYLSIQVIPQRVSQPPMAPKFSQPKSTQLNNVSIEEKIKRIDQEILILRAELALRNANLEQVRYYIDLLNREIVYAEFQQRIAYLKQYLISGTPIGLVKDSKPSQTVTEPVQANSTVINLHSSSMMISSIKPLGFSLDKDNLMLVVLLPLSDVYTKVGNQLLDSLNSALALQNFKGQVAVFDTTLYDTVEELWTSVQAYQPDFIFGPLQKNLISEWHALNTRIPTLYFNEIDFIHDYERSLSPNRTKGVEQIYSILEHHQYQNVLVLTDQSDESIKLEAAFLKHWQLKNKIGLYQHEAIDSYVSESMEMAMNAALSKNRKSGLQRVIDTSVVFRARTRTDFDAVISFLPEHKALQVTPMLAFYQLNDVAHIWYPSQTPKINSFKENLSAWQDTIAVLPAHLQSSLQANKSELELNENIGLFYALGQVAVEIVNNPSILDGTDLYIETEFGPIASNESGQFNLLPVVYLIDQGILKMADEYSGTFQDKNIVDESY